MLSAALQGRLTAGYNSFGLFDAVENAVISQQSAAKVKLKSQMAPKSGQNF